MKKRIDQLIFDKGLVESRTKAQAVIMSGNVFVDGIRVDKVGTKVDEAAEVVLKEAFPYVSRGALKLEKAYEEFGLNFEGKVICDIGSSTGGFTDFALQHGAKKVYAIDTGTGQLAQKLREDERVEVMERTDFRSLFFCHPEEFSKRREDLDCFVVTPRNDNQKNISDPINIFVCDVSFISLKKIIPKIGEIIICQRRPKFISGSIEIPKQVRNDEVDVVLLIKPQFEVGRKETDRGKGVITNPDLHNQVIQEIQESALENGFNIKGIVPSPITGAKGNKEFLLYLVK